MVYATPLYYFTQNIMPTLSDVDAYEVPGMLIPRLVKNHGYSEEYAAGLVKEAKRMLYLSASQKAFVSPSVQIDDAWHEMLLFTRWYQKYADYIGAFIHHDPTPGKPDGGKAYERTRNLYKDAFNEEADRAYWTD